MKTRSMTVKPSTSKSLAFIDGGKIEKKKNKSQPRKKTNGYDPKKPKKPPTAFFYYLNICEPLAIRAIQMVLFLDIVILINVCCMQSVRQDFKKTYQSEHPDVKTMRDIGKACGDKWKTMTFEEKVQYYDLATEKRAEYEKTLAAYIKKKESGDLSEEDPDDEY